MKLIPTDHIPEKRRKHNLQGLIEEFVRGPHEVVKCQFTEDDYKSPDVCATCLRNAVRRSKYSVRVIERGDEVYLAK